MVVILFVLIDKISFVQAIYGQLLQQTTTGQLDTGSTLDPATLPLAVREAAFVEAADCFAALIAKPEVCCCRHLDYRPAAHPDFLVAILLWYTARKYIWVESCQNQLMLTVSASLSRAPMLPLCCRKLRHASAVQ